MSELCYVCLDGVSAGELRRKPCRCHTLAVHRKCLAQEISANAGRASPLRCRVCAETYAHSRYVVMGPKLWVWVVVSSFLFVDQAMLLFYARAPCMVVFVVLVTMFAYSVGTAHWVAQSGECVEVRTYPLLNAAKRSP